MYLHPTPIARYAVSLTVMKLGIRIDDALRELEQRASRLEGDSGHWATKAEIAALRGELNTVKAELHGQIKSLESGLSSRLSTLMWCAGAGVSIVGVTVGILARILIPG